MILRPSLHPSSRRRWRNASVHSLCAGAVPEPSNPMTGTGNCSAGVADGHATAALLNNVMNSRRLMPDLGGFSRVGALAGILSQGQPTAEAPLRAAHSVA